LRGAQRRSNPGLVLDLRYGCKLLVWFEFHDSMQDAIAREKQIKAGSRKKKLTLIEANNPSWRDLYEDLA
jgi:putative endonuclease